MRRNALLLLLGLTACATDYDLSADKGEEEAPDEEDPTPIDDWGDTDEDPEDTGEPEIDTGETTTEEGNPIAVCSVSPGEIRPISESATWIGADSYDPEGGVIVNYRWSLVSKPAGSATNMASGSGPNRTGFSVDLAGEYVGRLVVSTDDGRVSEPCEATLTAVPVENLWIEMYWQYSDDDMDLHLVRPGGSLETDGDCYFANCTGGWYALDWGSWGVTADDPSLDLDDIPGTGPKNINIQSPENGTFTVYVHDYYLSTGDSPSSNQVTVNIYIGGSLEWTGTKTFSYSEEDTFKAFASISWPTGLVTGL